MTEQCFYFSEIARKAALQAIYLAALEFVDEYSRMTGKPFPKAVNIDMVVVENDCATISFEYDGFTKGIPLPEDFRVRTDHPYFKVDNMSSYLFPVQYRGHTFEAASIFTNSKVKI